MNHEPNELPVAARTESSARVEALHDQILLRIGCVAVAFSQMEQELCYVLRVLIDDEHQADVQKTLDELSFIKMLNLLKASANKLKSESLRKRVGLIAAELKTLGDDRNSAVHSCILMEGDGRSFELRGVRAKSSQRAKGLSSCENLVDLAQRILRMESDLRDFLFHAVTDVRTPR